MEKDLISVITPCYNTGKYIHNLLDSLLMQTYPKVEILAVDDGSTDDTAEVIKSYMSRFKEKGYQLTYIYQKNAGQSVAVNNALKRVQGEFLVWPDSDDFYSSPEALEKLKRAFDQSGEDVSSVRCLYSYLDQDSLEFIDRQQLSEDSIKENYFEDCIFDHKDWNLCPGGYMVRMKVLDECIPNREIYTEHHAGQNWQLMAPLLYHYKCVTVMEYLYNTVIRRDSHSRGQYKTYEQLQQKFKSYENTVLATLGNMPFMDDQTRKDYIHAIKVKYSHIQLNLCMKFHKKREAIQMKNHIENSLHSRLTLEEKTDLLFCSFPAYYFIKKLPKKISYRLKRMRK